MARTQARGGFGTKILVGDGAGSETFTELGEVRDVSGPELRHVIEDATHMASDDGWAESISVGLKEAGPITFDLHNVPDSTMQAALRADLEAGTLRNFRLVFPGATKRIELSAFVESMSPNFPVRGVTTWSVSLRVSGRPVVANHS